MEAINIELDDLEPISLDVGTGGGGGSGELPSVNFGSGVELLMNEKQKAASGPTSIDLGELDKLEDDLNNLSSGAPETSASSDTKSIGGLGSFASGWFGGGSGGEKVKVDNSDIHQTDSNLGQATSSSMGNTKTWDGFTKIGEISQTPSNSRTSSMTDREKRRKKRMMIQKLQEWYDKGLIKNNSNFTMESNYEEVEDEYEGALEDKRKKDSIKLQGWWFTTFVNSIEYANSAFNPFDINLDGWGEQVSEDLDSYEEIFAELHEKYKGGKMSPEISLLLRLGFSAAVVNFTNKALSSATPAFNDVIKQSPELMKMFTNATVSSMSENSPGFNMAANMMRDSQGPSRNMGPPPAPVETKNMPPPQRPGAMNFTEAPSNRPDISMGRGAMFREEGIDISNQYENPNKRPEMKGPQNTDIDNILAGLKPKAPAPQPVQPPPQPSVAEITQNNIMMDQGDDSIISISSLKDMQNANMPRKSNGKRKNGSNKNTVSLDI